jgi:endonuclease/exonuclease/phosphatase (EEP) superfamily protein YafD
VEGEDLRLATFNINQAFSRKEGLGRHGITPVQSVMRSVSMLSQQADVLLFQETHDGWVERLSEALKLRFPHMHHAPRNDNAGGLSIFSRFALVGGGARLFQPKAEGSVFPAALYQVTLPGGRVISIFNVHLRPPVDLKFRAHPFSMLESSPIRVEEIKHMLQAAQLPDTKQPLIIAGDWNENDGMLALTYCVDQLQMRDCLGLSDAWTHWWMLGDYCVNKRLDHIVVSDHFHPLSTVVYDQERGSDHFAVLATMKLK